jgi:hypothetical protein
MNLRTLLLLLPLVFTGCVDGGVEDELCSELRAQPVAVDDLDGLTYDYTSAYNVTVDREGGRILIPYRHTGVVNYRAALWDGEEWSQTEVTPGNYVESTEFFGMEGLKIAAWNGRFFASFPGVLSGEDPTTALTKLHVEGEAGVFGEAAPVEPGPNFGSRLLLAPEGDSRLMLFSNLYQNAPNMELYIHTGRALEWEHDSVFRHAGEIEGSPYGGGFLRNGQPWVLFVDDHKFYLAKRQESGIWSVTDLYDPGVEYPTLYQNSYHSAQLGPGGKLALAWVERTLAPGGRYAVVLGAILDPETGTLSARQTLMGPVLVPGESDLFFRVTVSSDGEGGGHYAIQDSGGKTAWIGELDESGFAGEPEPFRPEAAILTLPRVVYPGCGEAFVAYSASEPGDDKQVLRVDPLSE